MFQTTNQERLGVAFHSCLGKTKGHSSKFAMTSCITGWPGLSRPVQNQCPKTCSSIKSRVEFGRPRASSRTWHNWWSQTPLCGRWFLHWARVLRASGLPVWKFAWWLPTSDHYSFARNLAAKAMLCKLSVIYLPPGKCLSLSVPGQSCINSSSMSAASMQRTLIKFWWIYPSTSYAMLSPFHPHQPWLTTIHTSMVGKSDSLTTWVFKTLPRPNYAR